MHGIREVMKKKIISLHSCVLLVMNIIQLKKEGYYITTLYFFTIHCTKIIGMLDQK